MLMKIPLYILFVVILVIFNNKCMAEEAYRTKEGAFFICKTRELLETFHQFASHKSITSMHEMVVTGFCEPIQDNVVVYVLSSEFFDTVEIKIDYKNEPWWIYSEDIQKNVPLDINKMPDSFRGIRWNQDLTKSTNMIYKYFSYGQDIYEIKNDDLLVGTLKAKYIHFYSYKSKFYKAVLKFSAGFLTLKDMLDKKYGNGERIANMYRIILDKNAYKWNWDKVSISLKEYHTSDFECYLEYTYLPLNLEAVKMYNILHDQELARKEKKFSNDL